LIRKVYRDFLLDRLRHGGIGWVGRRALQYLLLHLSALTHRPLCGPALGTLMVTYRCNFHCAMCDMPLMAAARAHKGLRECDTSRFKEIIGEFAGLGVPGIGFTGGEPLLRRDIFELLAYTRQQGMITHLNTNGWFLDDAAAARVIEAGVDSVNISLDGACPATHDRIRNQTGAFTRAVAAVERLHRLRRIRHAPVRVKTVAVIDETNIDEVPEMLRLGRELGTDCIEFIPRQPFREGAHAVVPAADEPLLARVDRLSEYLLTAAAEGGRIENSPPHLKLFRYSFAGRPSPIRCRAGYNSLAVDCYGNVFPCVPWINWGKAVARLDGTTLHELWHSRGYQSQREAAAVCGDCYLNCQAELNLLFDPGVHLRKP